MKTLVLLVLTALSIAQDPELKDNFHLSLVHFNDFHSRFEPITVDSSLCKTHHCIGGFSRLYATIKTILNRKPQSILLNGGDTFEGTPWYDIFKWNVTQHFMNKLPIDANVLGNHEFEDGIAGLVPYLEHLKSPVVAANIDHSQEPALDGLYRKSVVVERGGRKIGVIGVIWARTKEINDLGNLKLLDESKSVNAEAERLVREEGVFTNIVLSHCGYDIEKKIAKKATSKISVIVGAHSHSFLYTGDPVPGYDIPVGPYPTVITSKNGNTVLVVQASSYTKYLGHIGVCYNSEGTIINWSGTPIYLDDSLPQDSQINEELKPWKEVVDDKKDHVVIGSTLVRLEQVTCSTRECTLGNFVTDAMVFGYTESPERGTWTNSSIALIHGGGLRSGIDTGNMTFYDVFSSDPFGNTIDQAEIDGKDLLEIFETSARKKSINLLQVSGIKITYDMTKAPGSRVTSVLVRCRECDVPMYEKLDKKKTYRVLVPDFLANGGFGFDLFKEYLRNRKVGPLDTDLFVKYIKHRSPIFQENEGRITILT